MMAHISQAVLFLMMTVLMLGAPSSLWAQDQVTEGLTLLAQGRAEEAARVLLRGVKADPSNWTAWYNLAVAYHSTGKDVERAISAYRKCIEQKGDFAPAYYNMGVAYQEQGKYNESIQAYRQAVSLNPGLLRVDENPIIVNNPHVVVLQVYQYLEQTGTQILPPQR